MNAARRGRGLANPHRPAHVSALLLVVYGKKHAPSLDVTGDPLWVLGDTC